MPSVLVVGASQVSVADLSTTVSDVDPEIPPETAAIVVVPVVTPVATPFDPAALLMVATPAFDELQVTEAVMVWVELSEYVPVAVNCCVPPFARVAPVGETFIETSVAAFTVRVVDPEMLPKAALIVVVPVATEVANPFEPAALLIVATPVLEELQVTLFVRFCVEVSE